VPFSVAPSAGAIVAAATNGAAGGKEPGLEESPAEPLLPPVELPLVLPAVVPAADVELPCVVEEIVEVVPALFAVAGLPPPPPHAARKVQSSVAAILNDARDMSCAYRHMSTP
jgi:hypothetical protein